MNGGKRIPCVSPTCFADVIAYVSEFGDGCPGQICAGGVRPAVASRCEPAHSPLTTMPASATRSEIASPFYYGECKDQLQQNLAARISAGVR